MTQNLSLPQLKEIFEETFHTNKEKLFPSYLTFEKLAQAVHYSTDSGKRLRALLAYSAYFTMEEHFTEDIHWAATAVELFHAFTLVHDDLPALDNDDYRRGKLSCHKQFDEETAILCGDLLQSLSLKALLKIEAPSEAKDKILNSFSDMSIAIMFGQMLDLNLVDQPFDWSTLRKVYEAKTATLIATSLCIGALTSTKCDDTLVKAFLDFGHNLGLAFQVQDDLMDIQQDQSSQQQKYQKKMSFADNPTLAEVELQALFETCEKQLADLSQKGYRTLLLIDILNWIKIRKD